MARLKRLLEPVVRSKLTLFFSAALFVMVVCPALIATLVHGPQTLADPDAWVHTVDARKTIRVYRFSTGTVTSLPLNDYLLNVLAAEYNKDMPRAALEAEAVAARTYAVHAIEGTDYQRPTFAHAHQADVTDSGTLDLPWLTMAEQEQKFGDEAPAVTDIIEQAIAQTDGQILTYHGKPILAFMFPLSGGKTRDARTAYQTALPYLPAVSCPDDLKAPNLHQTYHVTREVLEEKFGIAKGTCNPSAFQIGARDASGYVLTVMYGNQSWTGDMFAERLNLPSSHFTLRPDPSGSGLVIVTTGIGSGFGMSLNEAKVMAKRGAGYASILARFYPGTKLEH